MKLLLLRLILFVSLSLTLTAASAQAQTTLYWGGGTSNIGNGTALPTLSANLTGTWDNSTTNWSNAYSPTVYAAWGNGSIANLGYFTNASGNANMTISGNKTFNGMVASLTAASSFNRLFNMSANSATTLTLGGGDALFLISAVSNTNGVVLGGNLSLGASSTILRKDGAGLLQISGNNSDAFTGKVLIRSGVFSKGSGTSLAGVTDFEVSGYRPTATLASSNGNAGFTVPTLTLGFASTAGTQTQINDAAVINLGNRGTLNLAGGNATGTETIGSLVAQGTGFINNSAGTAGQTVNFGTLTRGTAGRATYIVIPSSDTLVQNIRITNTTGLTTDTLLPWLSTSRGEWLSINSTNSNQLTRVASTNADLNAANWVSTYNGTSNVRINGVMTNSLTGNLSLNSLGILGTASDPNLNLGGNILTLNSGALGLSPSGNVNNTISNGTIQTSSSNPLYINTGSNSISNLTLDAILAGNMDIYISGITSVILGPTTAAAGTPNTYNGTVYVNSGSLVANKDAAITGNVVVAPGGGLYLGRANATATTSNLTFGRDAVFSTGALTPTLGGVVTMNGSQWLIVNNSSGVTLNGTGTGLAFNGGAVTYSSSASGVLNLLTNVSYAASSETQAVFQRVNSFSSPTNGNFIINLNTGVNTATANRTFDIVDSSTLAAGTPEMLIDTVIANGGSGTTTGGLIKTGNGTLMLTGSNTYTGGTTVNGGTLQLGSITAAASSNLTGTFTGTSAVESEVLTFAAPITGTMAFGQTITGTGIGGNRSIAGILNDYQVVVNGSFVGSANSAATDIALGAVNRIGSLAGNVTINSGGTVLVSANTTFSSGSSIAINSGGFLRLGANGTAGSIGTNSTLSNNGTIVFQRSNTLTQGTDFANGISGTGTLLQAGSGTTILGGTNSFNGTVSVQSGSLVLSGANAVGSSASLVIGNVGATLSVNASQTAGTLSGNGSVVLASSQTLTLASSSNSTFDGQIQGAGNLAKAGTGTLTLAGANTNNGTISISAGTLLFQGASSLSTSVASLNASTANATLSLADGTTRNSTISGSLSLNASAFRFDLNGTTADFLSVGGNASLTGAGKIQLNLIAAPSSGTQRTWDLITAAGAGGLTSNWVLDDQSFAAGDFTWSLSTVSGNTLRLSADPLQSSFWWSGNQSSLWTTAANWSTNSAGSSASGSAPSSTIDVIFSATVAGNRSTSLGADMSIQSLRIDDSNGVSIAAGNTLTLTGSGAGVITIAAASGTTTINATLSGAQAGLTKSGLGTLVLNAANSYSGATTLTAGTLQVANLADGGVASSIGNSNSSASNLVLGTATLIYTGSNTTSNRNFTLSDSASTTLRVDNASSRLTLTGNSAATTGALVIQGPGTLALSGSNLHSGGTTLANGTLQINSSSALGTGLFTIQGGTIDNTSGAPMVLANSQSWAGDFTFTGSNNLTTADVSLSGNRTVTTVSGTLSINGSVTGGGLTKSGAGTLVLAGNGSYSGSTTVTAGSLRLQGGAAIPDAGALILSNSAGVAVSIQNSETIGSLQGGGLTGGSVSIAANATLTVAETGNQTFAGTISGAGNFTKSGAGTLTLSNTMNATGAILISGGTLATGAADIFSSSASIIANSATLKLGGNQTLSGFSGSSSGLDLSSHALTITSGTIGGLITGTNGTLIKNGASGFSIFSTANTFSGQTILNAGSITVLNTGRHFGNSTVTINNGTLTIGSNSLVSTTDISNLVVVSGTIQSGGNASSALSSNGSIIVQSGTISSPILGAATLSKQSAGVFLLSGNNTYSGGTTVSAGTLRLSGNGTLGTGAISISGGELDLGAKSLTNTISGLTGGVLSNGTLTADGGNFNVSAGTITAVLAGSNGLVKSASGTVVLSAANNYSGGTTVSAGTLRLSGNGTLGTGAISISGGELDLGAKSLTNTISGLTGGVLSNGTLTANGGNFNVSAGTITAVLAGSNGLVKSGNGTVALSASNSYSGATTVNSGTLQAAATGALGNSTVIDVNGGSFLVTAENAVNSSANIKLGGGTLAVSGNFNQNVGALTLSADSIIDLNGFSGILRFSGLSWASGASNATLAIWNWSGITEWGTKVNDWQNPSQVVFADNANLTAENLAKISFYSGGNNSGFIGNAFSQSFNEPGFEGRQIIAVPEPETYFSAVALLSGLVFQYLRRRAKRKPLEGHRPA